MAKHWETICIGDFNVLEVEVLEGFNFTQDQLIEDYYESLDSQEDRDRFIMKHKLTYIGEGHFGEVFGLGGNLAIKLLHNLGEEMPDGYILSQLNHSDMTPNVYAYSDQVDAGFMIVDRVVGENVCDIHSKSLLGFDLEKQLKRISQFLEDCKRAEVLPSDLHQANVMCTYEGDLMIVDVGCFEYGSFDPHSLETKWCYENAKWELLYQAYLLDHVVNDQPMKHIPDYIPRMLRWESEVSGNFDGHVKEFLKDFRDYDKVVLPQCQ
ncbi:serine-threonine kinase [Bacillus phage Curly]|uniref:Serine-threonine kinase n=1 Tax=Bacillus phage Curly TaxID=2880541 RepID=M1I8K6_9CAUD|nr:serine-threonine kinase [Bacillus phage Curly]AGE60742.1 serine-threonine kinase [Bacillus phage Curly]